MKPKTVLTTGQLLQRFEKNDTELFVNHRKSYLTKQHGICGQYIKWKYNLLTQNEKLMQTPLSLGMFVPCKDGEPINEPSSDMNMTAMKDREELEQAMKEVLFEGYKITEGTSMYHLNKPGNSSMYEVAWIFKDRPLKELNIKLKQRTIEDLARQLELIPNDNFWAKVGL